jgi:tRNA-dihydrouridine synthase A
VERAVLGRRFGTALLYWPAQKSRVGVFTDEGGLTKYLKRKENALALSSDDLWAQKAVGPTRLVKFNENNMLERRFCIAPMMDWTDRHCRFFHRCLTRRALVYTEMLTVNAVLHGKRERLLTFDSEQHPIALQLGGSTPKELAVAAAIAQDYGYDEVNLNIGCPSERVQEVQIGACLMAQPQLVADCVSAMRSRVDLPITVKCRVGIDDQDGEADLDRFVNCIARGGCRTIIVHARKAWLRGLSPRENREIPPLDYERIYRLKAAFPELEIVLNGGIKSLKEALRHLVHVDGVMLGRAAYQTPFLLAQVDGDIFGDTRPAPTRAQVLEQLIPYAEQHMADGGRLNQVVRHVLGLCHGRPHARAYRRLLSEGAARKDATPELLRAAIEITQVCETSTAAAA